MNGSNFADTCCLQNIKLDSSVLLRLDEAEKLFAMRVTVNTLAFGEDDRCVLALFGRISSVTPSLATLDVATCESIDADGAVVRSKSRARADDVEVERECSCPPEKRLRVPYRFSQQCAKLFFELPDFEAFGEPIFDRLFEEKQSAVELATTWGLKLKHQKQKPNQKRKKKSLRFGFFFFFFLKIAEIYILHFCFLFFF